MNEKFWDLKKSKQDNMINGSLKVFAAGGFRHASTDEIVAEAEVSKGLLFHYFYSKAGLYEFLTEYSARFALVELGSEVRKAETLPFFDLHGKITRAQARVMRQYPYLLIFPGVMIVLTALSFNLFGDGLRDAMDPRLKGSH